MDWHPVRGNINNLSRLMLMKSDINSGLMNHIGSRQTLLYFTCWQNSKTNCHGIFTLTLNPSTFSEVTAGTNRISGIQKRTPRKFESLKSSLEVVLRDSNFDIPLLISKQRQKSPDKIVSQDAFKHPVSIKMLTTITIFVTFRLLE